MADELALSIQKWKTAAYRAEKSKEWRAKNPEKALEYTIKAYKKRRETPQGWAAQALPCAKRRAARRGLVSDICAEDVYLPMVCPITGVVLVYGSTHNDPCSASFDRIDPSKGYVKGNVRIICRHANLLRGNCTDPSVFLALALDAEAINGRS